jgi:GntR family transcriptional regulator, rspAB operon transcriptional repressor
MRRALEGEIVHDLAASEPASPPDLIERLREHIARQSRAVMARDYAEFTRADRDFHLTLYEAVGMGDLWQLVRQRSGHIDRLRRLHLPTQGKTQAVVRDHRAIVEAIEARDPARARQALRDHLAGTLAFVDEVRREHPELISG